VPLVTPTNPITNSKYLAAVRLRCFARKRLEKPLGGLSEQL
jgi:hypothetical protein